ncbi:MAG: DUF47 family protein, partial [Chloroflexi bacterium]|nr:DUF47 family protein [Chloroflexota bacterium]
MRWLSDFFRPKQDRFIRLLMEQAHFTVQGMQALEKYMRERNPESAAQVARLEKEADEVRRILIDELNRTFVTPLDREDIFTLSRDIDDVLDYANTTVEEMELLQIQPDVFLQRMA